MNLKSLALGLALALAAVAPAAAQRGGNWELLGEENVGFGADRDIIRLSHDENFYRNKAYRRLRFVASGGEVRMRSVRLVYLNGHAEDVQFEQNLQPGQEVDIDLRGERSYLRHIEMFYKAKFGISLGGGGIRVNQPSIKVFGDNVRGGPPPRPEPPIAGGPGWHTLTSQSFATTFDWVELQAARRERIGQIRLQNSGHERINVRELTITFGNGQTQTVRIDQRLESGEATRSIDLEGDTRFIRTVGVSLEPRRRPGQATLTLVGTERPGRDDGPRPGDGGGFRPQGDWVPLGQQTVGFGVDRDIIRVNQSEDWFRNRGFDKLHFVAANNDLHMMSVRVRYINGYSEDYQVDRRVPAGGNLTVDLPGRRSYISEIEMIYRARPGFRGQSVIQVFGEAAQRRF